MPSTALLWSGIEREGVEPIAHDCTHLLVGCCVGRQVCTHAVSCTHGVVCSQCWRERCPENGGDEYVPREPGCQCHQEEGDGPCPVHGEDEAPDADISACECGAGLVWDPACVGTTCGGLELEGGLVCMAACGRSYLSRRSRPVERWKVASGGRSIDTGVTRLRAEKCNDPRALFERIAKLPELEREVVRLRAENDALLRAVEKLGARS